MIYDVMIDFTGTMHYEIEADSHDEAYEKVKQMHKKVDTYSRFDVFEENYYVEDERGYQLEY